MTAFHTKYRPLTLDTLIGHEAAVTRLKGMVSSGKIPNALLITGPSSVGKTTLARALTAALNGIEKAEGHPDYIEVNAGEQRTIEDVRSWIQTAKFRPQTKKRVICIDEAQGVLSNAVASAALLKPLEEPAKNTLWILCSMDPQKFTSGNGLAIAKRCTQFVLESHTNSDLLKQAVRIAKGEKMKYVMDEEKSLLKAIVKASGGEMRSVANLLQAAQQYYEGLDTKPSRLSKEHISKVLSSTESSDDRLVVTILTAVYGGKFKEVQRSLLDAQDGFQLINKLLWANSFVLNDTVLDGARHRKVWATPINKELRGNAQKLKVSLGALAATNATLVEIKGLAQQFATSPEELLSAKLYRLIKEIHPK
jgi:DNA polymerase III gamma/tau subunit